MKDQPIYLVIARPGAQAQTLPVLGTIHLSAVAARIHHELPRAQALAEDWLQGTTRLDTEQKPLNCTADVLQLLTLEDKTLSVEVWEGTPTHAGSSEEETGFVAGRLLSKAICLNSGIHLKGLLAEFDADMLRVQRKRMENVTLPCWPTPEEEEVKVTRNQLGDKRLVLA